MTVEMKPEEAELLIAILQFAEGAALATNPPLVRAIADLRGFRSALLEAWLRNKLGEGITK